MCARPSSHRPSPVAVAPVSSSSRPPAMASFLKAFNASLVRRPMLTQCASSAVMFGIGDVLAQQAFEKKGTDHDFLRTARTAFYGGALFGPLLTKWLDVLNRLKVQSRVREVVYKVWLDQTVFTPGVVGFFFTSMTLLEGKSFSDAQERLSKVIRPPRQTRPPRAQRVSHSPPHSVRVRPPRARTPCPLLASARNAHAPPAQAYVPTLVRNWGVFVPTQVLNFAFVPPQYRFFTIGTVALFWNAYLSAVNASNARGAEAAHAGLLEKAEAGLGAPPADAALAVKA
ncbi:hypothetical protein EVJ58_g9623 [Rhodofomes roseus]|uniref:Uncharacterized protein n=1 Tax=Rhodofomes roseus TaxID=34475 RepID=A0A4Y9XS27_9APHY|nr:hypothetical protein EVJ58_g9623 [Rhodofomes roseus]